MSKKLSLLRLDKAAGADNLRPRLLKEVQVEIKDRLKTAWRKSLDEGQAGLSFYRPVSKNKFMGPPNSLAYILQANYSVLCVNLIQSAA